jgi:class 3 adenylate cyclase
MRRLSDYTSATTATELYAFLAQAIVEDRLTTFSDLLEYVKELPRDNRLDAVLPRLFKLIRKLNWGFFRDIDPATFPKVWQEVVIPDRLYPQCGRLKRNLTISNVFVGIVDLHGYTKFCEKNKNNLSMLQLLDDMIQVDVANLARQHNVVLQRRQGDEMVMVGASASDVLAVTLLVLDYFSKRRTIDMPSDTAHRSGYKIILEEMHISAGIAGGKKFTPFIITRDGDLSGGVVNTAARLQGRANELSSHRSMIIVSRTVYTSFVNEMKVNKRGFFANTRVDFFDCGWINFKGISVALHEVLYSKDQMYKLQYEALMVDLYKEVEKGSWKGGIFEALMTLLYRVYRSMDPFKITLSREGKNEVLKNEDMAHLVKMTLNRFKMEQDYEGAVEELEKIVDCSRTIPSFDRLCLEYAEGILESYSWFRSLFKKRLENRIDERAPTFLSAQFKKLYEEGQKGERVYKQLRKQVAQSLSPLDLSLLWSQSVDEGQGTVAVKIHSGKQ